MRTEQPQNCVNGAYGNSHSNGLVDQRVIDHLYSTSVAATLWNVASKAWGRVRENPRPEETETDENTQAEPPTLYPEYTGKDGATYVYRDLSFWTSGFFPGSLYLLLERQTRFSMKIGHPSPHPLQLQHLCEWWTINLHQNASLKTTHDLGFMIAPWAIKAWELHRNAKAFSSLVRAADSLASRFCSEVQAIRSWDTCVTKRYSFTDPTKDFLVIIDNMINLDMMFWVARETNNPALYDIALAHARTTQKYHIRPNDTTYHVVNFDAPSGLPKEKLTNQGLHDESCWARGQAWGILGFAQTFHHTGDSSFLETSQSLANCFIRNLPQDGVPYWDFDAQLTSETPRDTSAGMIAACGMLLIYKALQSRGQETDSVRYLDAVWHILEGTVGQFMNPRKWEFDLRPSVEGLETYEDGLPCDHIRKPMAGLLVVDDGAKHNGPASNEIPTAETILTGATINNYQFAPRRWANHGLVYADYYFILLGNMLIDLDLVDRRRK